MTDKRQKRWEFVPGDEITIATGRTVKRIRALVAIDFFGVSPGDLGGYVESEANLAQISGNAWVYDDAWVSGDARVCDDARVYGDGLIFWASKVGSENGTLTVYNTKANTVEVTRGCFRGSVAEFLAASAAKHDARIKREYELLIEVATSRIEAARAGPEVEAAQPVEEAA